MRSRMTTAGAELAMMHSDREDQAEAASQADTRAPAAMKLFLDVHHLGAGKVTAEAAADAHQKDLATQAKYDVNFKSYWLDEEKGDVYRQGEAPSADAVIAVHGEAHGLLPDSIAEVTEGR